MDARLGTQDEGAVTGPTASSGQPWPGAVVMVTETVVEQVVAALARGEAVAAVARAYGLDRKTVRTWGRYGGYRPRARRPTVSQLDPYRAWMRQRAPEVGFNAAVMCRGPLGHPRPKRIQLRYRRTARSGPIAAVPVPGPDRRPIEPVGAGDRGHGFTARARAATICFTTVSVTITTAPGQGCPDDAVGPVGPTSSCVPMLASMCPASRARGGKFQTITNWGISREQ